MSTFHKFYFFFIERIGVNINLNTGNNPDHYNEDRENLLTLDLKIGRFGLKRKTSGGDEFHILDILGTKVRSYQINTTGWQDDHVRSKLDFISASNVGLQSVQMF